MSKFIIKKSKMYTLFFIFTLLLIEYSPSCALQNDSMPLALQYNNLSNTNTSNLKDIIEIKVENNKYMVYVKFNSKVYVLKTAQDKSDFGNVSITHPLKSKIVNLSRNGTPEIIISTFQNNTPTNYLFVFDGNNFINILTSNDNLIGILNSKNTKTPILLTLASNKGDSSTNAFMLNKNKLKNVSFSKQIAPGVSSVQNLIDIVQSPYIPSELPNIFTSEISSEDLSILWSFNKDSYDYAFQGGFFYDIAWNRIGETNKLLWTLSFSEINKTNSTSKDNEILIQLIVENDSLGAFKISSIKKILN